MDRVSIQQKIDNWLKSNQSYAAKPTEEIISAMVAANALTLSEAQEISLFGVDTIKDEPSVMPVIKPHKTKEEVLAALELRLMSLALQVSGVEKDNSFVESAWSWIKDKTGYGDSLSKVKDALKKDMELFDKLKNNEDIDLKNGDCPYNADEIELLLEGQLELKSQTALNNYKEGQEMASDIVGDLTSGIGAVGIYSLIALTGGAAAIPLAIGGAILAGGVIKVGTKALDNLGSEQKYDTLGRDLLTGGFSGVLAPVTAGLGGVAGKAVAKALGLNAIKTVGKNAAEGVLENNVKQIVKNALLNPAGYQYKGGVALTRGLAYGTEMSVDGTLGGGFDSAYRAVLDGEDVGEAFVYGSVGGLVAAPIIGGGFKLAGKGASKIAEKVWKASEVTPPLTTPNKHSVQTTEKQIIKPDELGEEAKRLYETIKAELPYNNAGLLRLCLDENGNVIPEAKSKILNIFESNPTVVELINNMSFHTMKDIDNIISLVDIFGYRIEEDPRMLIDTLAPIMDDNGYVDSILLEKVIQIQQKQTLHMQDLSDVIKSAQVVDKDGNRYIDLNVLEAVEEGYGASTIEACKDVNGVFQKGNLEAHEYIETLLNTYLNVYGRANFILKTCKNQDGIIYYPKLRVYSELLSSRQFLEDNTYHEILPLVFDAKGEYQTKIFKKLIGEFNESFIKNNHSYLEPVVTNLYKSGGNAAVEKLLNRLTKFNKGDCGLLIKPFSTMPDEEFNKFCSMIDKRFTRDVVHNSNEFLASVIVDGKFNEELADIGLNYWSQGVQPRRLGLYIDVLKTEYPGVTFEEKKQFISELVSSINQGERKRLSSDDSLRVIRLCKFILERQKPEYKEIVLDLANKKVETGTIEEVINIIYRNPDLKTELLKRVEYLGENGMGNSTITLLKNFSRNFEEFDDEAIEWCIKLKERGCNPRLITELNSNNKFMFNKLEEFEKAVFAKRNILKSGTEDLSDYDLFRFVYFDSRYAGYKFLKDFDLSVLEASFGLKLDGVQEFLEQYSSYFNGFIPDVEADFFLALSPKKALAPKLQEIQDKIRGLKSSFKDVAASGDKDALNNLKKQINDATTQERKIQSYIKEATLEPLETINKIRTLMAFVPEELKELIALIKPNIASDEMIETIKKDPAIMQAFENRANKNQDLKTWYSCNVLKPKNDATWNEAINKKIYEKLDLEYDEALAQKLQLQKSQYLPEILCSDGAFIQNFKDLVEVLQKNPELSVKDALDTLEQNIFTRKKFKELGIDYDKWTTVDKNHFKAVKVELDADEAKVAAIRNLEEDLSNVAFKTLSKVELKKLYADLEKIGVTLKEVKELAYDADGYQLPDRLVTKLYKNGVPITFKDLPEIISTLKLSMNTNEFWTQTHPDNLIDEVKNTMYNHIMKLRDAEVKNAVNLKENQVSNLEIHQVDMNDISHALFLGNHGHCCTAVGTGVNQYSAPNYIMNKCIQAIEIMDGEKFVGNTMCYIAKVDGKTSLVLDNIEVAQRYQDNNQLRDAFMEYARELCKRIGQPNMPIYAGPYRHKFDMNIYKQSNRMVEIQGSTDGQDVYIDYLTDGREIDNIKKDNVNLFRIN